METKNEKWKVIPKYPRYMISDQGRVMSFTSRLHPEGKIMKQTKSKSGYAVVHLVEGTERKPGQKGHTLHVHRLMAEAFIPVPPRLRRYGRENLQCDHILPVSMGGKPELSNLRWCTAKENMTMNEMTLKNLEKANLAKSKTVYVYNEELELLSAFTSTADAARQLNKSQGNITSCATGSLRRYLGYIFSYVQLDNIEQREEIEESRSEQRKKNYQSILKACHKHYRTHREEAIAYQKKWQKAHPEKCRARYLAYYYKNRDEILAKRRERDRQKKENKRGQADIPA